MIDSQKAIDTIRIQGPVIPSKIAKVLGTDIILASAVLSELVSSKKIKISKLKVGGSPVYFLPGQENKLENFKQHLAEKDRRTLDLLKRNKVLRDRDVSPLIRVSLREIKDFAVPLQVNVSGQRDLFWKWHLLTDKEAEIGIGLILNPQIQPNQEKQNNQQNLSNIPEQKPVQKKIPEQKSILSEIHEQKPSSPQKDIEIAHPPVFKQKPPHQFQPKDRENIIEEQKLKTRQTEQERTYEDITIKTRTNQKKKTEFENNKTEKKEAKQDNEEKPKVVKRIIQKILKPNSNKPDYFIKVEEHFLRKNIEIIKEISKKKNSAEYLIKIPSSIGDLTYYCRVKDKKRITDSDLDAVFAQGQLLKFPMIFITNGELNKKAQEKLKEFKSILIKKI